MQQFAVVGLGRFGSSVALTLRDLGHEVLGIDRDETLTHSMSHSLTHVVQADATDEETLRALGLRNMDAVVVAIGDDLQASILVTLLLKELGVRHIVAKATNDLHGKVLLKVGADRVVYPEREMGARVAHNLVATNILDYIELSPEYSIIEIEASDWMIGKDLRRLDLRARFGFNVVAIKRGEKRIIVSPKADEEVEAGDVLVIIGDNQSLKRLEKK